MDEIFVVYFTTDTDVEIFGLYRSLDDAKDAAFEYFGWDRGDFKFRYIADDGETELYAYKDDSYTLLIERMEVK